MHFLSNLDLRLIWRGRIGENVLVSAANLFSVNIIAPLYLLVSQLKLSSSFTAAGADPELVSRGAGAETMSSAPPLPHSSPPSLLPSPVPSRPSLPYPSPTAFPSLSHPSPPLPSLPSPPLEEEGPGVLPRKILKFLIAVGEF